MTTMIFRQHSSSHTSTTIDCPPKPPPKDGISPRRTLEEILGIAVSPRAPKPPPHAYGTVAHSPHDIKIQAGSASSSFESTTTRRVPYSKKTGHATIHTDAVNGHDAFESDAFAVYMPTTRVLIIDRPVAGPKPSLPTKAQMEAFQTYREKAEQARERNNSVGVYVPTNIASYDCAHGNTLKKDTPIPAVLKPSSNSPAPVSPFSVSPPVPQDRWTRLEKKPTQTLKTSEFSNSTSVCCRPTMLGVTTAATVVKESVHYVPADASGGASRSTPPPKPTTVMISMKPKVPSIRVDACKSRSRQVHKCQVEHSPGTYYRPAHVGSVATSCSSNPTKSMPKRASTTTRATPPANPSTSPTSANFDIGISKTKSFFFLTLKVCLILYAIVALWFILDALREALCVICMPFQFLGRAMGLLWAVVTFSGKGLGVVVES